MDSIKNRRSIRRYTNQPLTEEAIYELLEAGMCAPSAGNEKPWHFVVIEERSQLEGIMKVHPYSHMLKEAPLAIVVCADLSADRYPGTNYWVQDCSAATENILIAAQELGLGTCWLGIYPVEERVQGLVNILGLPENIVPFSAIAVGYPAERKEPIQRYDEIRVHRNRW